MITGTFSGSEEFYRALQGLGRCIIQTFDRGLRSNLTNYKNLNTA